MNTDIDWRAYVQGTHSRYVIRYLALAEAHNQRSAADYSVLADEQTTILTAMERAYQEDRWKFVLSFMSALQEYLHLQGHWREAAKRVSQTLDAAKHLQDTVIQVRWMFYAGLIQDELGNYDEAESYYQRCLDLAPAVDDTGIQAEAWRRLGWLAHVEGERPAAEMRYQHAIELHRQIDDRQGEARDWRQLGLLALEESDFDQAERYLHTSLKLVTGSADGEARQLQAGAWLDLGRIALRQGHLDNAREQLERALIHAKASQDHLLQADICFHQAMLAEEHGDFPKAKNHYQEVLKLAREVGYRRGEASALIALGTLTLRQSNSESGHDQARDYYERALRIADRHNQAVAKTRLVALAYLQCNYQQATDCLTEAVAAFRELNHRQELAGCYQQLGLVAQARHRWLEAREHYQASLNLRLQLGLSHDAVQSLYQLGTLAQQLGQLDAAQRYYQKALDIGGQVNFSNLAMIRQALENLTPSPAHK